jgi:ESSS subunit of NADH:ubiquinone oxidoreductase (complex I)
MLSSSLRSAVARNGGGVGRRTTLCRRRFGAEGGHGGVPVPQSQHAKLFAGHPESEGWESTVAWFYPTSFLLMTAVLVFEPETSINVWAKQEAAARLKLTEETGFTDFVFGVHYQDLSKEQLKVHWDQFSAKAIRMTDDDDDDDDEDDQEKKEEEEEEE